MMKDNLKTWKTKPVFLGVCAKITDELSTLFETNLDPFFIRMVVCIFILMFPPLILAYFVLGFCV